MGACARVAARISRPAQGPAVDLCASPRAQRHKAPKYGAPRRAPAAAAAGGWAARREDERGEEFAQPEAPLARAAGHAAGQVVGRHERDLEAQPAHRLHQVARARQPGVEDHLRAAPAPVRRARARTALLADARLLRCAGAGFSGPVRGCATHAALARAALGRRRSGAAAASAPATPAPARRPLPSLPPTQQPPVASEAPRPRAAAGRASAWLLMRLAQARDTPARPRRQASTAALHCAQTMPPTASSSRASPPLPSSLASKPAPSAAATSASCARPRRVRSGHSVGPHAPGRAAPTQTRGTWADAPGPPARAVRAMGVRCT